VAAISDLTRYRELSPLGSGGMATVVLAEDLTLRRLVALKRVHTLGSDRGRSRMRREALVGASLSHPNLVSVYDVLAGEGGEQTIVMEYVEGQTLRDALSAGPGLGVPEALRVIAGVSAALDAIHRRGIVHRDVKPANILLDSDGRAHITDFGLAKDTQGSLLTLPGQALGSLDYMSPEQVQGEPVSAASDIYALGCVIYECVCGKPPFAHVRGTRVMWAHLQDDPPDPRSRREGLSEPFADALLVALRKEPYERPKSAGEYARLLEEAAAR
jgi:eukaryotic-like serine/threonine-protein kinase